MPIADNTFDAAYAIEATCHAPDAVCLASYFCPIKVKFSQEYADSVFFIYLFIFHPWLSRQGVYSEVYRVLKPGQYFALDEWCLTDRFDPNNAKHLAIKAEIELGDGLPDIRTTHQCVQAMKDAGFEVPYSYY